MYSLSRKGCRWLLPGCLLALAAAAADVSEDPRYRRALDKFQAGDLEASHRLFKQLEEGYPDDPGILNNLGIIAARQGRLDLAARLFEKAIATAPVIATGHRNLRALYAYRAARGYKNALALDSMEVAAPRYELVGSERVTPPATPSTPADAVLAAAEIESSLVEEPAPPARASREADAAIVASVRRWARAWAGKNLDDYFTSYAGDYRPRSGTDHEAWKRQRRDRILGPKSIHIEISGLQVRRRDDGSANVTFVQKYRSNLLASTVTKNLLLRDTADGWKIARERVVRRR